MDCDYYQNLYTFDTTTVCNDVFQFILHKNKCAIEEKPLTDDFFPKKASDITVQYMTNILRNFLHGKYYGQNLKNIQSFLKTQLPLLEERDLCQALLDILAIEDLSTQYEVVLQAINNIYKAVFLNNNMENSHVMQLMQDKYFRYLVMGAISLYWKDDSYKSPKEILLSMQSKTVNFGSDEDPVKMSNAYLDLEQSILKQLSDQTADPNQLYECGYKAIALVADTIEEGANCNLRLMAGLCFLQGAGMEADKARRYAAENFAILSFTDAIEYARKKNTAVALYTMTHALKYLFMLKYDHGRPIMHAPDYFISSAAWRQNPIDFMQGAMQRVLYLLDIAPFYTATQATVDLNIIAARQFILGSNLLYHLLDKEAAHDHDYSKIVYHLYENTVGKFNAQKDQPLQDTVDSLRWESMNATLEKNSYSITHMANLMNTLSDHVPSTTDGWLEPINELHFSDNIKVYKSFDGYTVNLIDGSISLRLSEWKKGDPVSLKLFTDYDVDQMLQYGVSGGVISLEQFDSSKQFLPLQAMRFNPAGIFGTELLKTLFMADYLLKMFILGQEISVEPPYKTRPIDALIARLPPELKKILNVHYVGYSQNNQGPNHRIWITAGEIEKTEKTEKTVNAGTGKEVFQVSFGNIKMHVNKRSVISNHEGKLVDDPNDNETNSPAYNFAESFAKHYNEIGEYFPVFLRLKELVKVARAVDELRGIRIDNNEKILNLQQKEKVYGLELEKQIQSLQAYFATFPKFVYQLTDREVMEQYQKIYDANYQRLVAENYQQAYEAQKNIIVEQHGITVWNSHEAKISGEIKENVIKLIKDFLDKNRSELEKLALDNVNAQGAAAYLKQKQYVNEKLSSEWGLSLGAETKIYEPQLEAFMKGDCTPLATYLVDSARREVLQKREAIEKQYVTMKFDSLAETIEKQQITEQLVPSVNCTIGKHAVWGGIIAIPNNIKQVDTLTQDLQSCYRSAIPIPLSTGYAIPYKLNHLDKYNNLKERYQGPLKSSSNAVSTKTAENGNAFSGAITWLKMAGRAATGDRSEDVINWQKDNRENSPFWSKFTDSIRQSPAQRAVDGFSQGFVGEGKATVEFLAKEAARISIGEKTKTREFIEDVGVFIGEDVARFNLDKDTKTGDFFDHIGRGLRADMQRVVDSKPTILGAKLLEEFHYLSNAPVEDITRQLGKDAFVLLEAEGVFKALSQLKNIGPEIKFNAKPKVTTVTAEIGPANAGASAESGTAHAINTDAASQAKPTASVNNFLEPKNSNPLFPATGVEDSNFINLEPQGKTFTPGYDAGVSNTGKTFKAKEVPSPKLTETQPNLAQQYTSRNAGKSSELSAWQKFKQSGGRQELTLREHAQAERVAQRVYDEIRTNAVDTKKIASNTGMHEFKIKRIKEHLFMKEHKLLHGEVGRFDPDPLIAESWKRLESGSFTQKDIQLLNHELFESKFEGIFKSDYISSHTAANRAGYMSPIESLSSEQLEEIYIGFINRHS